MSLHPNPAIGGRLVPATGGSDPDPATVDRLVLGRAHCFPNPIRMGCLCSGMKTSHWCISDLQHSVEEVFWCERDPIARKFILANLPANVTGFHDLMSNEFQEHAPTCDLLLAGFPCQPFSIQGRGQGLEDEAGRGIVIVGILRYVKKHMPRIVMLENVLGLVTRHRVVLDNILVVLRGLKDSDGSTYTVSWKVLNSRTHGSVPCNRSRVYIVAIKQYAGHFVHMAWPNPQPATGGLRAIFNDDTTLSTYLRYPFPSSATASRNIRVALSRVLRMAKHEGKDPTKYPVVVDTGGSSMNMGIDYAPCLTKARGGALAFWSLQHGRALTIAELCRLQGLEASDMCIPVTARQMGALLGNGFTRTTVSRILAAAISAAEG